MNHHPVVKKLNLDPQEIEYMRNLEEQIKLRSELTRLVNFFVDYWLTTPFVQAFLPLKISTHAYIYR